MSNAADTISAYAKNIACILRTQKYDIDVFQREYKWERKQIEQLLSDLESKFLSAYNEQDERRKVEEYPPYYLGSIIVSSKGGKLSIIDGQQRLTSITLLLIHLHNLQKESKEKVEIESLIFSEKYAWKTYNLIIADRRECMDALYNGRDFNPSGKEESVRNICLRLWRHRGAFPKSS